MPPLLKTVVYRRLSVKYQVLLRSVLAGSLHDDGIIADLRGEAAFFCNNSGLNKQCRCKMHMDAISLMADGKMADWLSELNTE